MRENSLEYTILGPGMLTLELETNRVVLSDDHTMIGGRPATSEQRKTIAFYDGDKPIDEALV